MKCLAVGVFAMLCGLFAPSAWGEAAPRDDAVEAGRRALERRSQLPWYDAPHDTLRRWDLQPQEEDENRHSRWAASDHSTDPAAQRDWSLLWSALRIFAWAVLCALMALILWGLIWAARRLPRRRDAQRRAADEEGDATAPRFEDLSLPVAPQVTDLLAAARACFQAGDCGQALVYAFAHQLMELDKHHLIQLSKGKTNRQYLRELSTHPRFVELVQPTLLAFEDFFFGHHHPSRQRFEACWKDLDRFHQQLEQLAS